MRKGLGLVGAGLTALGLVAASNQGYSQPTQPREGRYMIVVGPQGSINSFLLDTATGKVWQLTQSNGIPAWTPMTRLDSSQEVSAFLKATGAH